MIAAALVEPGGAVGVAGIRDQLRADWIENRRNLARDDFHARMRKRYEITINWPAPWRDLPSTPDPAPKTKPVPEVGE